MNRQNGPLGQNSQEYGYPPDRQEKTTRTVSEQGEALTEVWTAA